MAKVKPTLRFNETLIRDMNKIAKENYNGASLNFVAEIAFKEFRDKEYMKNKATIINEEIINVAKSIANVAERNINNKTSSYLSELAIQNCITNMILAKSLQISKKDLNAFRTAALGFLKEHQRILKLNEIVEE